MDNETQDTNNELYQKLARLQWLLQRYHLQRQSDRGRFADSTRGQGRVLAVLKLQPEISTKDLSYLLGIRQQSLNELLNKMEKAGYVVRTPSDNDRRIMIVSLTEKGRAEQQAKDDYSSIFDCLEPEEQVVFSGYLDRVIASFESRLGLDDNAETEAWIASARERIGKATFDELLRAQRGFRPPRPEVFVERFHRRPAGVSVRLVRGRPSRHGRPTRDSGSDSVQTTDQESTKESD